MDDKKFSRLVQERIPEKRLEEIRHRVGLAKWGAEADGRDVPDEVLLLAEVDRLREGFSMLIDALDPPHSIGKAVEFDGEG